VWDAVLRDEWVPVERVIAASLAAGRVVGIDVPAFATATAAAVAATTAPPIPWVTASHVLFNRTLLRTTEVVGVPDPDDAAREASKALMIGLTVSLTLLLAFATTLHLLLRKLGAMCGWEYKCVKEWNELSGMFCWHTQCVRPVPSGHGDKEPDHVHLGTPSGYLAVVVVKATALREPAHIEVMVDVGHTTRRIRPTYQAKELRNRSPKWNKKFILQLFDEDLHGVDADKKTVTVSLWKCERLHDKDADKISHEHSLEHKLHLAHQKEKNVLMGQVRCGLAGCPARSDARCAAARSPAHPLTSHLVPPLLFSSLSSNR